MQEEEELECMGVKIRLRHLNENILSMVVSVILEVASIS